MDDMTVESIKALARISRSYGVPAELGGRISVTREGRNKSGTIVGAIDSRIRVLLDERPLVFSFDPGELRFSKHRVIYNEDMGTNG